MFLFMLRIFTIEISDENLKDGQYNGIALISFDEGPSDNIKEILNILQSYNIKACFHLDPEKIDDHKNNVKKIISNNHTIGISIIESLKDLKDNEIKEIIIKNLEIFKKFTGYKPKLIRLPRCGYDKNAIKVSRNLDLVVTEPTIDTEDIEIPNYLQYLIPTIQNLDPWKSSISLVLRDYKKSSVENLHRIINTLISKGFFIVSPNIYLGSNVNAIKLDEKPELSENRNPIVDEKANKIKKGISIIENESTQENTASDSHVEIQSKEFKRISNLFLTS